MRTLIIHPYDYSTEFLAPSYEDLDATVIRTDCSRKVMKTAIKRHERVIMMGHGDGNGMFGHDKYVINSEMAYALQSKHENVYIWCNAHEFVKRYNLRGFYTGMIVSELQEASMYCLPCTGIDESNELFTKAIKASIHNSPQLMRDKMREIYNIENHAIIEFNRYNLYAR